MAETSITTLWPWKPTKSPDKHSAMPSIEQMHPLLHNGQSWMHTQATSFKENPPFEGPLR
ncbi:hypothetical protein HanRHA438_Chr05g0243261 [Helianthus annuus]|nr:hypothetical protein HanRHA438_Chr05g0243261 [Helianthus annuus]